MITDAAFGSIMGLQKSPDDFPADDWRRTVPRFSKENFPKVLQLCDEFAALGKKYNATSGQIALAWLLAQGDDIIPIPGTTKIEVRAYCYNGELFAVADSAVP